MIVLMGTIVFCSAAAYARSGLYLLKFNLFDSFPDRKEIFWIYEHNFSSEFIEFAIMRRLISIFKQ